MSTWGRPLTFQAWPMDLSWCLTLNWGTLLLNVVPMKLMIRRLLLHSLLLNSQSKKTFNTRGKRLGGKEAPEESIYLNRRLL